jgi:hypothetical protein
MTVVALAEPGHAEPLAELARVEWTTDRDNPAAQRFYAQLGVPVHESKLFYRIEGDQLHQQAARR